VEHLSPGDIILLPRGDKHHISDAGQPARWLCGTFTIGDPRASHLLGSLPAAIILRGARGPALEGLEVAPPDARGRDAVALSGIGGDGRPQIGPALSAVHRDPAHDWTVTELARACSLSRSAFAARFVARVGKPPASYLAHVRLDAATGLLRDTSLPVTLIAENVGYTSEAAFSRAFKHRYGTPPARWRRERRARHT
jgi:AraC-like DNA-binding protein